MTSDCAEQPVEGKAPGSGVMVAMVQQQADAAGRAIVTAAAAPEGLAISRKRLCGPSDPPTMPVHDVDIGVGEGRAALGSEREATEAGQAG